MNSKFFKTIWLTVIATLALISTSCGMQDGFWPAGGMYGSGYIPGVPYYLQPNVAAQQAAQQYFNNLSFPAVPATGIPQTGTVSSGGGYVAPSSSSSSTSSSSSSSSNGKFCTFCSGTGHCSQCRGTGYRTDNQYGTGQDPTKKCGICHGSGKCSHCGGRGRR